MKKTRANIDKFIAEALAIEAEEAREAGALGFMARAMTQATMPHSKTTDHTFVRENGALKLAMMSHPDYGLPYGCYPRLLLSWMTTEAVRTKIPELEMGHSLSGFMSELGLIPTGGRWGTTTNLSRQMEKLFTTAVSCTYKDDTSAQGHNLLIAKSFKIWWHLKEPRQMPLWKSTVTLSTDFFDEIIDRPVPVDMRALKALKRSPLALDIYCWLTYRMSYLRKPTVVPWGALQLQFGSNYQDTKQGRYNFKTAFKEQLRAVQVVYPKVKVSEVENGLMIKPSPVHVAPLLPKYPYEK